MLYKSLILLDAIDYGGCGLPIDALKNAASVLLRRARGSCVKETSLEVLRNLLTSGLNIMITDPSYRGPQNGRYLLPGVSGLHESPKNSSRLPRQRRFIARRLLSAMGRTEEQCAALMVLTKCVGMQGEQELCEVLLEEGWHSIANQAASLDATCGHYRVPECS